MDVRGGFGEENIEYMRARMMEAFVEKVLRAYRKRVLFTRHALNQMNLSERMISRREVFEAVESDEVVEDYPDDPRGHICLLMGRTREEGLFM